MHTVSVRELDGALIVAVPPEVAEELHLQPGALVGLKADGDHLAIRKKRSKYTLEELMSQCDPSQPLPADEKEWMIAPSVGRELTGE